MKDAWSPQQYEKFKDQRAQPFYDLAELIEKTSKPNLIDLGCGTGELTRALHRSLGAETTLGLDSSEAMLEKAKPSLAAASHSVAAISKRGNKTKSLT